jgi:hypothetical protein
LGVVKKRLKVTRAQIAALVKRSQDAYSARRYASWPTVVEALLRRGYTPIAAETILRSKLARWAVDARSRRGRASASDLLRYLDRFPGQVASLFYEEGLAAREAPMAKAVAR